MPFSPSSLRRIFGILILVAVLALDQWSKFAVTAAAGVGDVPREIFPIFNLVMVRNHGISFGFLAHGQAGMATLLTALTSVVALLLFLWLMVTSEWSTAVALGFVIGGALGNIFDRMRYEAVTDFLDFHLGMHHWPAFNLADSAIFIGVVILVLISIVGRAEDKETPP